MCYQTLTGRGACCGAWFEGGVYSEIHVFRRWRGRFKIEFCSYPQCPIDLAYRWPPQYDAPLPEMVDCDERWRRSG